MGLARLKFRMEDPDVLKQHRHKSLPAHETRSGEGLDTLCQCLCENSRRAFSLRPKEVSGALRYSRVIGCDTR